MVSASVTVTNDNTVVIPAEISTKYRITKGTKLLFLDGPGGRLEVIPIPPLMELFGVNREYGDVMLESIRELHVERRREAKKDKKKSLL
jgi:bifunctional DNA-binding transcriptional regulator/antitoxin component of YhaV-PrlF toxin-antitoxin module